MKKLIIIATLLFATNAVHAIDVTINNNLAFCNIDITVTPLDGVCASIGSPYSTSGLTPGNGFVVDDPAATVFQIDITVWDGATPHTISTIYTAAGCGATSNATTASLFCNGNVATATVAPGGGPSYTVNVN